MPIPNAAVYRRKPKIWNKPCTHQRPGNEARRIMIPPTGKKKPNARVASTACAVMIVRPRSAYWDGMPPPLLLLLDPPPNELLELESEFEFELELEPPFWPPKLL